MPRQINFNGVIHNVPDDATDDEIRGILGAAELKSKAPVDEGSQPATMGGTARAFARQAPGGLSMIGGILGGVPGAAAGASFGQGLKNIAPSIFGEPGSGAEQVGEAAKDTLLQGVVPKIVGDILKFGAKGAAAMMPGASKLPAVKIAETINKAKRYMMPESALVETAAENARLQPGGLVAMTPAGRMLNTVESAAPAFTKITPTAKEIMSDIQSVRNAKLATGDPTIVRQIAANDLVTRNFSKAGDTIDPVAILDEIGKRPDVYEEAFGKPALKTFTDLMETAQKQKIGQPYQSLISWKERGKVMILGGTGALFGLPFYGTAGLILGADALKRIATNPALGQMILQATKTAASAPESTLLTKAIVGSLRGASLFLKTPDGKKEKVTISKEGQLQTPR